ncbi:MAG: group II truncated hemoglobin [Thiotrichales bacterium]
MMKGLSPYELIGGAEVVRALVDRFYDLMDTLPDARDIRQMHATDLRHARDKLYQFLVGWLGGPPLYATEHGPPMLRHRHLSFPIDSAARDQWLLCMSRAMDEIGLKGDVRAHLERGLTRTADHLRNRPDSDRRSGMFN